MTDPIVPSNQEIWQNTLSWYPNAIQQEKLQKLYEQIIEGNKQLNLTRITNGEEFWEKHLWDSLAGVFKQDQLIEINQDLKVIDVGTGGGFPGLPLAIIFPHWQLNLLDSTQKKMKFLDSILPRLELENVKTFTNRVENFGQEQLHRQQYDLGCIRAVAEVDVCAEYLFPLLKINGVGILYRGQLSQSEILQLNHACQLLGGTIAEIKSFSTPLTKGVRNCIYLKKIALTPSFYPRSVGIPKQKPLSTIRGS